MTDDLRLLQEKLCSSATAFCTQCFVQSPHRKVQNPPNVFRIGRNRAAKVFLVFDKPNNNDSLRTSPLVPITIFDPRLVGTNDSHGNLIRLLDALGLDSGGAGGDRLDTDYFHVTNAVKCDKCAMSGRTGRVAINDRQVRTCTTTFFLQELAIIRPKAVVFFGEAPQRYVLGRVTAPWEPQNLAIGGRMYWVMRVPHTSPQSFNTHGGAGANYVAPFQKLVQRAGL